MLDKFFRRYLEVLIFLIFFILANRRILMPWSMSSEGLTVGEAIPEFIVWAAVLAGFSWLIWRAGLFGRFVDAWKKNWPVLLFLVMAVLSLLWTVEPSLTLYRLVLLLGTTLFAAYTGVYLSRQRFITVLAWMAGIVICLCFLLAVLKPERGIMFGHPYFGAWRGIFWTRGRLGSFAAFANLIFLIRTATSMPETRKLLANLLVYVLSFVLLFLTRSATGLVTVAICHVMYLAVAAWVRWNKRLTRLHYAGLGVAALFVAGLIFLNLDFLFGLVGRNVTLTGRIPLWDYLLREVVSQRLWQGYGYGALWDYNQFRNQMQSIVGWTYPVIDADNGFLDILLHLGIPGLLALLLTVLLAVIRTLHLGLREKRILAFAPFLIVVYVVSTNLTLSYFLELESFVWFLLIAALFISTMEPDR